MSYLSSLRLHFCGRFQADMSTVNNDPEHFDDARFLARYQLPGNTNGWWNPGGSNSWRLRGCRVTQVVYDGVPGVDPLVGGAVTDATDRVSAKLVDLDPEQQMVSMIYGMGMRLVLPDGTPLCGGDFVPAPFSDLWVRAPGGQNATYASAVYQSVLTGVTWGDVSGSPFAQALRAAAGDTLSVKFTVDGYSMDVTAPEFTWGRIVGVIGPYRPGEPRHFLAERRLQPPAGSALNNAPFRLDKASGRLDLDLGNSLPVTKPGGPLKDLGQLQVVLQPPGAGSPVVLATVDTGSNRLNDIDAGIVSVRLDPAHAALAATSPVAVLDGSGAQQLAERPDGRYVRADDFVFRIYPVKGQQKAATTLYARAFGEPAARATITTFRDNSSEQAQVKQGPLSGPPAGVPGDALTVPKAVKTGKDGTAVLTLAASPPGNPRGYIDGQVYGVGYGWDGDPATAAGNELAVLVWDAYDVPARPTWADDVKPVLQQYANLYPAMRDIVDLSSYHSVVSRRLAIDLSLGLPVTDPNYMPATRDLSPGKRAMLRRWLTSPDHPVMRLDSVESLRRALQSAVEIEHATIPAYLYALFSIKPGRNPAVAKILRNVLIQEMLHLALACNLLNAVGGAPVLDQPGFVPRYPGHLPGDVRPDLVVSLRACSIDQVRDVFMAIEEPATTYEPLGGSGTEVLDTSAVTVAADGRPAGDVEEVAARVEAAYTGIEHDPFTIGWFYGQVARAVVDLSRSGDIFTGDPARQLTPATFKHPPGRLYAVTDAATALLAIHEIVRQGEGVSVKDPLGGPHELAHYYRFEQIVRGRALVQDTDGAWVFEGPPVAFDPAGVWPAVSDPQVVDITNPQARLRAAQFDRTYAMLLRGLHGVFNGAPTPAAFEPTIGLMFSLEMLAQQLMRMPLGDDPSVTAGPLFQPG